MGSAMYLSREQLPESARQPRRPTSPHIRRELIRGSLIPSHSNRLTDEPVASGDGLAVGTRRGAPGSHAGLGPGTRGGLQRASRVRLIPLPVAFLLHHLLDSERRRGFPSQVANHFRHKLLDSYNAIPS